MNLFLLIIILQVSLFGQTAEEYYDKGNAKFQNKDYSGDIKEYSKAINVYPNHPEYYNDRGLAK